MQETGIRSLGQEDALQKEMATHSSVLAWEIPRTKEPGGLQSIQSQRIGQDRSDLAAAGDSQVALAVKNLPANAGDKRGMNLIPGSGRSPGGRHGNPFPYSCLENAKDKGAWWATVHGVTKCHTRLYNNN